MALNKVRHHLWLDFAAGYQSTSWTLGRAGVQPELLPLEDRGSTGQEGQSRDSPVDAGADPTV